MLIKQHQHSLCSYSVALVNPCLTVSEGTCALAFAETKQNKSKAIIIHDG